MLNTNVRQRKENKKSARMIKQYSRNQSKKKCNGNRGTSCVHKNATDKEKMQGKKQTTGKNYFERKIIFATTTKAVNTIRKTEQYNEAGQPSPKQVANRASKKFRFQFKKKMNQSEFFKIKIGKLLLVAKNNTIVLLPLHWIPR